MKSLRLTLLCALYSGLMVGCLANPTPHPGQEDFASPSSGAGAAAAPSTGAESDDLGAEAEEPSVSEVTSVDCEVLATSSDFLTAFTTYQSCVNDEDCIVLRDTDCDCGPGLSASSGMVEGAEAFIEAVIATCALAEEQLLADLSRDCDVAHFEPVCSPEGLCTVQASPEACLSSTDTDDND